MDWKHLLAYITGTVDQELLLRNEYLVTENRILRNQIKGRIRFSDGERKTLAEIGQKLGKPALAAVATIVKPDTILGWHRKLVAQKFDGSAQRTSLGRPRIDKELEDLVMRMAKENRSWGYDRIAGAVAHLGYDISDQTAGNILKRRGFPPAPERKKTATWKEFIRSHMGFDHGVGHPLLSLGDPKIPNCRKNNDFKDLSNYSEWPKVADAVIKAVTWMCYGRLIFLRRKCGRWGD